MGRLIVLIALCSSFALKLNAQGKEIDKMVFLFIDENYEKCVKKGESLIESDEYRQNPLPYLYVSMSYYEISQEDDLVEKYPKAFKDALKYAYKYRKKDKNLEYAGKFRDYITTLKDSANNLAQLYIATEDYRKAAYIYKYIVRFDPDDHLMQLWQGISEIKARNVGEGERNMSMAMENIDQSYVPDEVTLKVAMKGFTEYAEYMEAKGEYGESKRGKSLAEKFKDYDPEIIKKKKAEEAEANKPKREFKKFETDEDAAKNQETKFIGSENRGVKDAKEEIEEIKKEQEKEKEQEKKFKTFSSDDDDEDDEE